MGETAHRAARMGCAHECVKPSRVAIDPRVPRTLRLMQPLRRPMSIPRRPPTSARHAFALAFDLAVRRDRLQSLWVPLLLHAPWLVLQAVVPTPDEPGGVSARNLMLSSIILLGDFVVSLLVASMLRFRALSVHEAAGGEPASALECYARGLARLPWLFATEVLRNVALFGAGLFLLLPGIWVGFRFSLATEAVVLRRTGVLAAFGRSYRLTVARLEPWLEMIAFSVVMVLCVLFTCALGFLAFPATSWSQWATVALFLLALEMSVIQYAWTFFYLRLEDVDESAEPGAPDEPGGSEPAQPSPGAPPRLTVVEGGKRRERSGG